MKLVVIAETDNGGLTMPTLECVEEVREVADAGGGDVHVLLPGRGVAGLADTLAAHGADIVMVVEHQALGRFSADGWLAALEPALREIAPELILAPDTGHTRAWLPRLAARWRAPLISGCVALQAGKGAGARENRAPLLEFTRPAYGGVRYEQWSCPDARTVFATLAPGAHGVGMPGASRRVVVTPIAPKLDPATFRDRVICTLPADPRTVDLSEAERIVSGGLGIGGPDGVALLQQLAGRLNAAVGGTRVIADRGWLPADRFIGTTGKIVTPKLYVALGISGASQHVGGMSGSETVIVVNIDRTAPLFGLADLGVIGDVRQIVPELLRQLGDPRGVAVEMAGAPEVVQVSE